MLLIAVISTMLSIFLWPREAKRIMRERKNTVKSAGRQLAACREIALEARDDIEAAAIFERSKKSINRRLIFTITLCIGYGTTCLHS